jgi:hypothetical protein
LIDLGEWPDESFDDGERAWPSLAAEAERFVIGLRVPYPWLVLALLREFLSRFVVLAQIDDPGPVTITRFGWIRWRWPGCQDGGLGRPGPPQFMVPDEVPKVEEPMCSTVQRKARWFYSKTVRGDSIRSIARAEFGDEDGDHRSEVRKGIAVVGRLFDLRPRNDAELLTNGWSVLALDVALSD